MPIEILVTAVCYLVNILATHIFNATLTFSAAVLNEVESYRSYLGPYYLVIAMVYIYVYIYQIIMFSFVVIQYNKIGNLVFYWMTIGFLD